MVQFDWNPSKNEWLRAVRGIAFEDVLLHIQGEDLLDVIAHANADRYPGQRIMVVKIEDYVWLVPFVESEGRIFLKTIIPSRKMTRRYLGATHDETD
jgi:uncharacterized DUF497 family protein